MKSNGNSFGSGTPASPEAPAGAATPLITTGQPPVAEHWWRLA